MDNGINSVRDCHIIINDGTSCNIKHKYSGQRTHYGPAKDKKWPQALRERIARDAKNKIFIILYDAELMYYLPRHSFAGVGRRVVGYCIRSWRSATNKVAVEHSQNMAALSVQSNFNHEDTINVITKNERRRLKRWRGEEVWWTQRKAVIVITFVSEGCCWLYGTHGDIKRHTATTKRASDHIGWLAIYFPCSEQQGFARVFNCGQGQRYWFGGSPVEWIYGNLADCTCGYVINPKSVDRMLIKKRDLAVCPRNWQLNISRCLRGSGGEIKWNRLDMV